MQAGKLDRRITIQRKTSSPDQFNEQIATWSDLATVWAAKPKMRDSVRDGEGWSAGEIGAVITTRFQIRYSSQVADISPLDRILFEGRVYDIVAVKEIGRREGLEITASARAEGS